MLLFVTAVALVLLISAVCSLTEAALYAVRLPYVRQLADSGSLAGATLVRLKRNMEQPISAILIINTAANTAGAAIAGAQAAALFGETAIVWFSALFTLAVLFFAEILPKIVGVVYSQPVARLVALPLNVAIGGLYPLVWLVQQASALIKPRELVHLAPEEEVSQMATISAEEGSILPIEAQLVKNVLRLNEVRAHEIMTPRSVVFKLPGGLTLREVPAKVKSWTHSRIPIYDEHDPEKWTGVVLSRDILENLAQDRFSVTLASLAKPLYFVSGKTPGHVLLKTFLRRRTHLFGVVDDYGGMAGIVTLEDVVESLIGEEIVDEADVVADLQEVARMRRRQQFEQAAEQEQETEDRGDENPS